MQNILRNIPFTKPQQITKYKFIKIKIQIKGVFVLGENHFRKWGCLVGPENSIFRKLKSVDRKKMALTTEIILHFHFHFKVFSEKERERERESARERRRPSSNQSDDRWRIPSSSPRRSHELQSEDRNPRSWSTLREIAISRSVDRDLAFARSRRLEIAPSIAIDNVVVGLELAKHRAVEPSRASIVDDFFFLGLSFPSSFPNTRKYFPKNFLKCNQAHENIFLSGNAFTRTKHSLRLLKLSKENTSKTNYFIIFFTNYWCGEWLLTSEKVM